MAPELDENLLDGLMDHVDLREVRKSRRAAVGTLDSEQTDAMIKLYKKGFPAGEYHEAWVSGGQVTEHWGRVGTNGETRIHTADPKLDEEANIERVLNNTRSPGFEELDEEDERTLLVEYQINGMGNADDVGKLHRLVHKLNEVLGWAGLGHCDGSSIGSGTMEACCYVADFEVASVTIRKALVGSEFADFSRIYDENEE